MLNQIISKASLYTSKLEWYPKNIFPPTFSISDVLQECLSDHCFTFTCKFAALSLHLVNLKNHPIYWYNTFFFFFFCEKSSFTQFSDISCISCVCAPHRRVVVFTSTCEHVYKSLYFYIGRKLFWSTLNGGTCYVDYSSVSSFCFEP